MTTSGGPMARDHPEETSGQLSFDDWAKTLEAGREQAILPELEPTPPTHRGQHSAHEGWRQALSRRVPTRRARGEDPLRRLLRDQARGDDPRGLDRQRTRGATRAGSRASRGAAPHADVA